MNDHPDLWEYLGVSGLAALLGAAVGYGRLQNRADGLDKRLARVENQLAEHVADHIVPLKTDVARIDERTIVMQETLVEIKNELRNRRG